jgi:YjbE family integral membrane protein
LHPIDHGAIFALLQVILIDIVLAGDNAIVIGMAAARMPTLQRRKVIFWGLAAAVVIRVFLASLTVELLAFIPLRLAGGILLLWVAWRLYRDLRQVHADEMNAHAIADLDVPHIDVAGSVLVRRAILQIAVADLSMSLDNVLAVAGAAVHHVWVLAAGLVLSIGLMGIAANFIAKLLQRHPWISYAGVLIVLYIALKMIYNGGMMMANS